ADDTVDEVIPLTGSGTLVLVGRGDLERSSGRKRERLLPMFRQHIYLPPEVGIPEGVPAPILVHQRVVVHESCVSRFRRLEQRTRIAVDTHDCSQGAEHPTRPAAPKAGVPGKYA